MTWLWKNVNRQTPHAWLKKLVNLYFPILQEFCVWNEDKTSLVLKYFISRLLLCLCNIVGKFQLISIAWYYSISPQKTDLVIDPSIMTNYFTIAIFAIFIRSNYVFWLRFSRSCRRPLSNKATHSILWMEEWCQWSWCCLLLWNQWVQCKADAGKLDWKWRRM